MKTTIRGVAEERARKSLHGTVMTTLDCLSLTSFCGKSNLYLVFYYLQWNDINPSLTDPLLQVTPYYAHYKYHALAIVCLFIESVNE